MNEKKKITEDDRPLLDIESNWVLEPELSRADRLIFSYGEKQSGIYRLVDCKNQEVHFNDVNRVSPERIIDINKKLDDNLRFKLVPTILHVINEEDEISFPYIPEKLTVYIEFLGDWPLDDNEAAFGILYYKDREKNISSIKRYFKMKIDVENNIYGPEGIVRAYSYTEISPDEYLKIRDEYEKEEESKPQK